MQIDNQKSNISFGTNIKIISPTDFAKIRKSLLFTPSSKNFIYNFDILKNCKSSKQCYRVNSNKCTTTEIRTCIGINITNLKKKTSSFFAHFYHSKDTLNSLNIIKKYIKGDNALIIGQRRDKFAFSNEIYDTLLNYCNKNNIPVTKLRGLREGYEADMSYEGKTDSLFICISKIRNNNKFVRNIEQLKHAFEETSLAPCDNIEFLKEDSLNVKYNYFQKLKYKFFDKYL